MVTLALLLIFVSGCGNKEENEKASVSAPATSQAAKIVDPATVGTIRGKVSFEGVVPEVRQISVKGNPECSVQHPGGVIPSEELVVNNGALQNVFVYVKEGLEGYSFTAPSEPAVMENRKCVYVPHVMGAMVGQPVVFLNQDSTLHNIHAYPKNSRTFNLGLPLVGMKQTKKFDAPEVMVPLKCDVHPWMRGYVGVLAHPFFAVTDAEGKFELKGLPPGEYTLEAWHEKLGVRTQRSSVGAQETKEVEFKFTA